LVALLLAIGLGAIGPSTVHAECDGPATSFREKAPGAPTVVIGSVTAIDPNRIVPDDDDPGRSSGFSLTVDYVLLGTAPETLRLEDLASGPCSGLVTVRPGDRLAVALGLSDRLLFGERTWAAVAWVQGGPHDYEGIERITLGEAFRLLGLQPPETSTDPTSAGGAGFSAWIALLAGLLTAASLMVLTVRTRDHGEGPSRRPLGE
jgi:hypothetical protein